MRAKNAVFQYLEWYFNDQPRLILEGWKNILRYNLNYFSVGLLLKTLFSPWRRYQASYGRGFDFTRYFETLTFNTVSRVLGAIMRIVLILSGLTAETFLVLGGAVLLLGWLFLPLVLLLALIFGFRQILF
ncbi:MAG: hypothetical protein HYW70_01620 [Candidatus Nealsonbacteria bacterium]|nr:hypothetical protein [Candidatus Nealsonbacteria bacterium]